MMKNIALPMVYLLVGGAAGYGLRIASEGGGMNRGNTDAIGTQGSGATHPAAGAGTAGAAPDKTRASHATPAAATVAAISLGDQMKDLLVDYDAKSAQKAAAKLSASDLQAALALVAAMPENAHRDALRFQLYRAWAGMNPNTAWQAALTDPLDNDKGYLLSAVAGEVAKSNPIAAIDLAQGLGMGGRRATVMNKVFEEWSKVDVAAAIAYSNAHPDQPVEYLYFSSGLSQLAGKDPMRAANLVMTFKDDFRRSSMLSSLMNKWMVRDSAAALKWAEALTNSNLHKDAIAAAVGAWAKTNPVAALNYARGSPDAETRTTALQNAWGDWFRKAPAEATAYLASAGDANLLENVAYKFSYLTEGFSAKERVGLLAQFPDGKAKQDIYRTVTYSQIRKGEFNEALELLNTMPDSSGRDSNVQQLGREWAKTDLVSATAWLKLQPDSSDRDLAVAGYASALARTDPAAALEWVKSIPDAQARGGAMKNMAIGWFRADAAKAEAWMATVPEFSESDKKTIRSMAGLSTDSVSMPVTVGTRR